MIQSDHHTPYATLKNLQTSQMNERCSDLPPEVFNVFLHSRVQTIAPEFVPEIHFQCL